MSFDESDPFTKLMDILITIENQSRGYCLLSIYLAQLADDNSLERVLFIYNKLTNQTFTLANLRRYVTSLVNSALIKREDERLMGKKKISFHEVLPLGELTLLYFLTTYIVDDPLDPLGVDIELFPGVMERQSLTELIRYLLMGRLHADKNLKKYVLACFEGKLEKIKLLPLEKKINITLSSKTGNSFKIYEALLIDYLKLSMGLSMKEISNNIDKNLTKASFKSIEGTVIYSTRIGKNTFYRMDRNGILLLPLILLFIKLLSADPDLISDFELFYCPEAVDNIWMVLLLNSKTVFSRIYG